VAAAETSGNSQESQAATATSVTREDSGEEERGVREVEVD
jgi:hypothetical protein